MPDGIWTRYRIKIIRFEAIFMNVIKQFVFSHRVIYKMAVKLKNIKIGG